MRSHRGSCDFSKFSDCIYVLKNNFTNTRKVLISIFKQISQRKHPKRLQVKFFNDDFATTQSSMRQLSLVVVLFCQLAWTVDDFGQQWADQAFQICKRLGKNRNERSRCETFQEIIQEFMDTKVNMFGKTNEKQFF